MIGLDTNVLLRLGDEHDPDQKARAQALVRAEGAGGSFLNPIVLSEYAWTLRRTFKLPREEVADRIAVLLESPEFVVADPAAAARALERYRAGPADFTDYLLAEMNRRAGCAHTATFDVDALKSGEPFSSVPALA